MFGCSTFDIHVGRSSVLPRILKPLPVGKPEIRTTARIDIKGVPFFPRRSTAFHVGPMSSNLAETGIYSHAPFPQKKTWGGISTPVQAPVYPALGPAFLSSCHQNVRAFSLPVIWQSHCRGPRPLSAPAFTSRRCANQQLHDFSGISRSCAALDQCRRFAKPVFLCFRVPSLADRAQEDASPLAGPTWSPRGILPMAYAFHAGTAPLTFGGP